MLRHAPWRTPIFILMIGFTVSLFGGRSSARAGEQQPLPEQPGSSVGYATVAAALADLHAKAGVQFSTQNGWTIATDEAAMTQWSFAPVGHPAYPVVVKRQVVKVGEVVSLRTKVLCEATKAACDDAVRSFVELNAAAMKSAQRP